MPPDLFYARHLRKQNFVLWYSPTEKPDLGGKKTKKCNVIVNKCHGGFKLRVEDWLIRIKLLSLFPNICNQPDLFPMIEITAKLCKSLNCLFEWNVVTLIWKGLGDKTKNAVS